VSFTTRIRMPQPLRWLAIGLLTAALPVAQAAEELAFPEAQGWAASTPGGRGGQILRVTTLAATGPGSLAAALQTKGRRIVVFEVGGVIDLGRSVLRISEPYVTIAGQTAPSPGITLVRGGLSISTHDVVVQHLRVRPGEADAPKKSWEVDAITTQGGAYGVIVDHCSLSWSTDENLSASGPRFDGATPDDWRRNTSRRITFSNNIIADGLAWSAHPKGEHSKGMLIHDNATEVLIVGNLFANNSERSPLFKGGVRGAIYNNLIYNPGPRAVHYNLIAEEWGDHAYQVGRMVLVGNVLRAGPSTPADLALFMLGGSGDLELYAHDNIAVDRIGRPLPLEGRYTTGAAAVRPIPEPPLPTGVRLLSSVEVQDAVVRNAGARPWDRDAIDSRIVADTIEGRGAIVNNEREVEGYPAHAETRAKFEEAAWDLRTMTRKRR
jgi:pectate lyase